MGKKRKIVVKKMTHEEIMTAYKNARITVNGDKKNCKLKDCK